MIDIYLYQRDIAQLQHVKDALEDYIKCENIQAEIVSATRYMESFSTEMTHKRNQNPRLLFVSTQSEEYSADGFTFVKDLRSRCCNNDYFVLLSSEKEQAYKVFEYGLDVLDYILTESALADKLALKSRLDRIFNIIGHRSNIIRKIFVTCEGKLLGINESDILCVQTVKGTNTIDIFLPDQTIRVRASIHNMCNQLGDDFFMASASCLISSSKVKEIDISTRCLTLENGLQHNISSKDFKRIYEQLTKSNCF